MRCLFILLVVLITNQLDAQDAAGSRRLSHELEVNTYSVNYIRYGGLELDYEFGVKIGERSELGIKAGVFYMKLRNDNQFSYIPVYVYYRHFFKEHNSSISLNAGTPLFWLQDDSRFFNSTQYWSQNEETKNPLYRMRIWLVNQLEYEYYIKHRFGISAGITNYVTEVSSSNLTHAIEHKSSFRLNPGFKLGLSYRF